MKQTAKILAFVFGLALLGATLLNADLISRSRKALASGVLRDQSALPSRAHHLAVVVPATDDSFVSGLLSGITEGAKSLDLAIQVFRYSPSSTTEAQGYFDIALSAKVDGLIMFTSRDDPVRERLAAARSAGIIFVPVGTDSPPGGLSRFVGSGSLLQGVEGATYICQKLGSAARVGIILAPGGDGPVDEEPLFRGAASALRAYPGATIAAAGRGELGLLSGEKSAEALLRANPGVNALLCESSRDTVGAAQVLVDTNRVGRVLLIGADETAEIRRYMEKGVIAASVVRDSRRIGEEALRIFQRHLDGDFVASAPETIEVGSSLRLGRQGAK